MFHDDLLHFDCVSGFSEIIMVLYSNTLSIDCVSGISEIIIMV